MREYYTVDGYWKDDKSEFRDLIVTNFDDVEENGMFGEDEVFLFGFSEQMLEELKDVNNNDDFIVTNYTKIIQ